MNIYGINNIPANKHLQTSSPSRQASKAFEGAFNRELTALRKTRDMPMESGGTDQKAQMLSRGDGILTLLESYAADLENPGKSLKQIAPLVDAIEHEVHQFEKTAEKHFSGDKALMEWVNDLSLTARISTVKFHRGDFL